MAKEPLVALTQASARKLQTMLREWNRFPRNGVAQRRNPSVQNTGHRFYFRNDSGETIPVGGIMRRTGAEVHVDGYIVQVMNKPSTTASATAYNPPWYVNLGRAIADDDYGWCSTFEDEAGLAYYLSGTIVIGDSWGPRGGQWNLERYYPGFKIEGNQADGLVYVRQTVPQIILAKADSSGVSARSGTTVGSDTGVVIQYMNGTTIGATNFTVTAYNLSASAVAADAYLQLTYIAGQWFVDYEDCG